jgi:hypothetical protein
MTQQQAPMADSTEQKIFLAGRPPLAEFPQFHQAAAQGADADMGSLAGQWRSANDHVQELEVLEAGYADSPAICELPPEVRPTCDQIMADPAFRRAYGIVPTTIGVVELDRLVVYQKYINLDHVARIQATLSGDLSPLKILRTCLPLEEAPPPVQISRVAHDTYLFVSASSDLRFLEPTVLRQDQVPQFRRLGQIAGIVGLVVGFTPNCFSVLQVEGRLILQNGSHRAYALRQLGLTHAPAVIQRVSRREELPVVAAQPVTKDPNLYLKSLRPPLLKDYFDEQLRTIVTVPRVNRQVKVVFASEALDLAEPA